MILDVGRTLTILIKKAYPDVEITGLDGDPDVLKIAEYKAKKAGLNIKWEYGLAFELMYPDNYFDKVVSSMVMHHLNSKNKINTFKEIF